MGIAPEISTRADERHRVSILGPSRIYIILFLLVLPTPEVLIFLSADMVLIAKICGDHILPLSYKLHNFDKRSVLMQAFDVQLAV